MKQQCHKKVLIFLLLLSLNLINAGKLVIDHQANQEAVEQFLLVELYEQEVEESYKQKLLQQITDFNITVDFVCDGIPFNFHPMALALLSENYNLMRAITEKSNFRESFNPNFKDTNGNTFLHLFLGLGFSKYLIPLLDYKELQFDVPNRKKITPLMIAITQKDYWWINTLLHEGANKYAMDASGKSVKEYMQEHFDNQKDVDFYFPRSGRSISIAGPEDFLKQEDKQIKNNSQRLKDAYNQQQIIMETRV